MPKNTFNKDAYLKMLNEKLGGAGATPGKKDGLASITQQLRQTIPKHKGLPGLR